MEPILFYFLQMRGIAMYRGYNDLHILFINGEEDLNGTDMIRRYQGNRRISELFQMMARREITKVRIGSDVYEVRITRKTEQPEFQY